MSAVPLVTELHGPRVNYLPARRAVASTTLPGRLSEMLRILGVPAADAMLAHDVPVTIWRANEGAALWHQGAPSQTVGVVRSGCFKRSRLGPDGYEQVLSFAGPGELLGFSGLADGHQAFSIAALESSTVFMLPWRELESLRQHEPVFDRAFMRAASEAVRLASEVADLMSAVSAEVRLARFLVKESERAARRGLSPRRLVLRMGRRDLASLLGLAHETTSRCFGVLAKAGLVTVHNREVDILDAERLRAYAQYTRAMGDDDEAMTAHGAACHPERRVA